MRKRRTHAEFVAELSGRQLEVVGKFKSARTKARFRCFLCGHEWVAPPHSILRGIGCPYCAGRAGNKILADHGDWLEVDISTKRNPKSVMFIDTDSWEMLKTMHCGRISLSGNGYPIALTNKPGFRRIHRMICPGDDGDVDHINGIRCDNRRSNLRRCSRSQNNMNSKTPVTNSSGVKGVSWNKRKLQWVAYISKNRRIHLGYFTDFDAAVAARKSAEKKYHGNFRRME